MRWWWRCDVGDDDALCATLKISLIRIQDEMLSSLSTSCYNKDEEVENRALYSFAIIIKVKVENFIRSIII